MSLDSASTELKTKVCVDDSVESFSLYDEKHMKEVQRKCGGNDAICYDFSSSGTYCAGQGNPHLSPSTQEAEAGGLQ